MKVSPILLALIVGVALALPAALMPADRLAAVVVASGLPALIPAARPPLGNNARTLLAVALGVAPLLVALLAIAIARHRRAAAEARIIADLETAEAGRRLFRPAPLPREPASAPYAPQTTPETVPLDMPAVAEPSPPEPAALDLTGAVLAAPEELGMPPPEPMPRPTPTPLAEPDSLRKPRPRPASPAAPKAPPVTGNRTRLDQLETMLGALPPLPQTPAPSEGKRKAKAKGAATARDLKSGVVRGSDRPADPADIAARLERALAELRRLER